MRHIAGSWNSDDEFKWARSDNVPSAFTKATTGGETGATLETGERGERGETGERGGRGGRGGRGAILGATVGTAAAALVEYRDTNDEGASVHVRYGEGVL